MKNHISSLIFSANRQKSSIIFRKKKLNTKHKQKFISTTKGLAQIFKF